MKYVLVKLMQLMLLYCLLAVVTEVAVANYADYQVNLFTNSPHDYLQTSLAALSGLGRKLWGLRLGEVTLV